MITLIENPVKEPPFNSHTLTLNAEDKKLSEYLLLLSPSGSVKDRVVTEKNYFSKVYGNKDAAHSLPHLTLANFISSNFCQEEIVCTLNSIAPQCNRIKVVLENYNWFPHHTIFIDVKYKINIKQLVRKITHAIKRYIKADNEYPPHFILNPHLTLCKGLSIEQYEKSVIEYTKQNFSGEFTANEMLLLKRSITEPEKYKEVARFGFRGPEVCDTTTQLKLFNT